MASSNEIMKPTVKELLSKPKAEILSFLGTIYEHSPWIAEAFYEEHLENNNKLYEAMASVLSPPSRGDSPGRWNKSSHSSEHIRTSAPKFTLTNSNQISHARKSNRTIQGWWTGDWTGFIDELTKSGKNNLWSHVMVNEEYKAKFQFPFILAGQQGMPQSTVTILSAIEGRLRLSRSVEQEFAGALIVDLMQVNKMTLRGCDAMRLMH